MQEATEDAVPTEQTPAVKIPADLANFLKTHMVNTVYKLNCS